MNRSVHVRAQLEIAYAAFQTHGLKSTTKRDRDFIVSNMNDYRGPIDANSDDLDAARCFFDYISARTKIANRVDFVDYQNAEIDGIHVAEERDGTILRAFAGERCLATATMRAPYASGPLWSLARSDGSPAGSFDGKGIRKALRYVADKHRDELANAEIAKVTESELRADSTPDPVVTGAAEWFANDQDLNARPVLYFEQDGAYFSYRDRPFYFVDFDYVGPDGMSAGVCPSFTTRAPFDARDFNLGEAELAYHWFVQEAAMNGFRVERAPDYHATTKAVPCHPDAELNDLAFARHPDRDLTSIAEFAVYRATPQEPVKRETFNTFETWSRCYLDIIEGWYGVDTAEHAAKSCEEHYTAGLTPIDGANAYVQEYRR